MLNSYIINIVRVHSTIQNYQRKNTYEKDFTVIVNYKYDDVC